MDTRRGLVSLKMNGNRIGLPIIYGDHRGIRTPVTGLRAEWERIPKDILKRYVDFYGDERIFADGLIPSLRMKLSSLSEFMREIKVNFARFYNRRHNRRGYFWGDRFKSVIVDKGETLVNCLAYIDLNPLRAGMVDRPEKYRWNSLGYHLQTQNKDQFLFSTYVSPAAFNAFNALGHPLLRREKSSS